MPSKKEQDKINLKPSEYKFSRDEQVKGGIRCGEVRRQKRSMRELASIVNSLAPSPAEIKKIKELNIEEIQEPTRQLAFILKVYNEAMRGNIKAMKLWVEISDVLDEEKKSLEVEKLRAEVEELKRGNSDGATPVSVTIEIKDCKK